MLADETKQDVFASFVVDHEMRLRQALTASFGSDIGKEAAAEALAYGWEHWDRIGAMDNPAGYLYRVGQDRARKMKRRHRRLPAVDRSRLPWVEPGLPDAFLALPEKQRIVVALLHGYEWSMSEVANYLDVSKGTVQIHASRGMEKLRRRLGVEQ